jgi:hypothetical protein
VPSEPDSDQPGGSYDPTRAHDPIDPTRAHDPVDATRVQGAAPAAGMGGADPGEPLRERPPRERDDDRKKAGWLWALLAAVLVGIVIYALVQQGDDDGAGTTDQIQTDAGVADTAPEDTATDDTATTDTSAPEDTAADDTATTETSAVTTAPVADDGDAEASDAGGDPGTVTTADGTDLFTLVQGDAGDAERLAPYAGEDVGGEGVYVLEVVEGEGFWIGADDQQRIFAHTSDDDTAEVGQRISFDGFLKPNPPEDSAEVHDIPEDQGAELHRQQGHHIELRSMDAAS